MKLLTACLVAATACTTATGTDSTELGGKSDAGPSNGGKVTPLPVDQIEAIVGAQGTVDNGVLDIEIERKDIGEVQGPVGLVFTPSFEIHGDLYFQPLANGEAFLNGDLALKEEEVQPFIRALLDNGLEWQAFHQHLPMNPQIWFVHFRGVCDPLALARAIRKAIDVTSTPLPQMMPSNPTTPLDPDRLASILHGTATVGDEGVVSVTVPRKEGVIIAGVPVLPETGISTTIEFKPTGGNNAQVVPDFSMTAEEIRPVVDIMLLELNWFQGCLYNQETAEIPQLYFDHMGKSGDAYVLAAEIRRGLDQTASE